MNLEVEKFSKEEVRENMKRMKNGKAVGPDDIPMEVWKCLGEIALEFLTKLYNRTMESERMPEEWRDSVLFLFTYWQIMPFGHITPVRMAVCRLMVYQIFV